MLHASTVASIRERAWSSGGRAVSGSNLPATRNRSLDHGEQMARWKSLAALTVAITVAAVPVGTSADATPLRPLAKDSSSATSSSISGPELSAAQLNSDALDPAGYWTQEMMDNAIPADLPARSRPADPSAAADPVASKSIGPEITRSDPVAPQKQAVASRSAAGATVPTTVGSYFTYTKASTTFARPRPSTVRRRTWSKQRGTA